MKKTYWEEELDKQKERAEDHFACCLAEIVEQIKKKKKARQNTGTFKYDEIYDEIIKIIKL